MVFAAISWLAICDSVCYNKLAAKRDSVCYNKLAAKRDSVCYSA